MTETKTGYNNNNLLKKYPDEVIASSETEKEFHDLFKEDEILMIFSGQGAKSDSTKTIHVEDPDERYQSAKKYAEEHNAQVYTQVDGDDDGHIHYSKGFRLVNRIDQGLYTVVKVEGLEVDNS